MNSGKAKGLHPRREPNGRLSRSTDEAIDAVSPAAALAKHADPLWGTEVGRLFLTHKITSSQFEASRRWSRLSIQYRKAIGAPAPHERPGPLATIGEVRGRGDHDDPSPDSPEGRRMREKRLRTIGEMESALAALGAAVLTEALRHTVELDRSPVGIAGLDSLRSGLDRLARAWGLTR